jgi:hypothetical protein
MAWVGSVNQSITNGAGSVLFAIKTALLAAGWSIEASGSGTAGVSSAGDNIPTAVVFGKAGAWARMREPVGASPQREYIFQNSTLNGANAIIKYSRATGFLYNTGGNTPGFGTAIVAPITGTAPLGDGVVVVGTGSDNVPVAVAFAQASGYTHAIASDTVSPGSYGSYAFYSINYVAAPYAAALNVLIAEPVAVGSTSVLDQDPTIRYFGLGGGVAPIALPSWSWWQAYGLAGATYVTFGGTCQISYGAPLVTVFTIATVSPYDSKVPMYPMMVSRGLYMPKGYTTGALVFNTTQNLVDTFNLSSADARIAVSVAAGGGYCAVIPWITNVIPLV